MKKTIFRGVVAALTILVSAPTFAMCSATICSGKLERVIFDANGKLFLRLAGVDIRDSACTGPSNYALLPETAPKFKEFYAMALTAYSLDADFSIRVNADSTCSIAYTYMIK